MNCHGRVQNKKIQNMAKKYVQKKIGDFFFESIVNFILFLDKFGIWPTSSKNWIEDASIPPLDAFEKIENWPKNINFHQFFRYFVRRTPKKSDRSFKLCQNRQLTIYRFLRVLYLDQSKRFHVEIMNSDHPICWKCAHRQYIISSCTFKKCPEICF